MKVLVLGNCQAVSIAKCADLLVRGVKFDGYEIHSLDGIDFEELLSGYRKAYLNLPIFEAMDEVLRQKYQVSLFPRISFNGFHPDSIYLYHEDKRSMSPVGAYHSAIVFGGWWYGLSTEATFALFDDEVFRELGYTAFFEASQRVLYEEGEATGVDMGSLFTKWMKGRKPFMLTMNHPAIEPLNDVAKVILKRDGFSINETDFLPDHGLLKMSVMPVYPGIAEKHGMSGSTFFKRDERLPGGAGIFALEEYIEAAFAIYETWDRNAIRKSIVQSDPYACTIQSRKERRYSAHPYKGISDHQNWRKAISSVPMEDVDPVVVGDFKLTPGDKVATAGSCFAQHLAKALSRSGLNYYVAEDGDPSLGYGVYSARYGNIYTTVQLNQLIERAYGRFEPEDVAWQMRDGQFADPFRPEIPLARRESIAAIEEQRIEHFAYVRTMFESLDYFVFTLGLTEAWRSKRDGAVFPIAPGVAAGEMDFARYEFVNFKVDEVSANLLDSVGKIRAVNPKAKFILTVSPVPLMATYASRHVLVSTTYSKSVLRIAAEEAAIEEGVFYFPSYEIITGNFNRGAYYEDDLRSVKPEGVEHVMRLFLKHCSAQTSTEYNQFQKQIEENNDVLCAEDMLDI